MTQSSSSGRRPIWPYIGGGLVLAMAVGGYFLVRDLIASGRPMPGFSSLADAPDPSLHGTVAYFGMSVGASGDPKTRPSGGCVRVVAAAGTPSKDVLCFDEEEFDTGPQLVFLPDGRLEVTMFSWPPEQPLMTAWQKIVDVGTGETEDVPSTQLPEGPTAVEAIVSPSGEQILARSSGNSAELVLVAADGTSRTLWSAEVPLNYSIVAIWAPSGDWILACDTRLLIVTPGDPAVIRVLVAEPTGIGDFGETDPLLPHYAVTDLDLLSTEG